MLNIFKFLLKPLKTEYLMIFYAMKTVVMIFSICWLMVVANAIAVPAATFQQQPQTLNYKQQLQYQMQQHDKFEYQQHIKQQQQYYQQQYHQQNTPTAMALMQEQQQHQQRLQHQQQQQQFLAIKPTQMLQTAASLVVDDSSHPEALALGQSEFSNANAQRRRPGTRKRKRRPQASNADDINTPIASNSPPYWRGQVEDDREALNIASKSSTIKPQDAAETIRTSSQASFKRRKQPAIREPLAALEKEQKLYEMRNKPDTPTEGNVNRNSINLKNILKNSGGLSLSEILQQKNLSLDDLLKGKENALQALQTTATAPLEKSNQAKYPSFKPSFKSNTSSIKLTEGNGDEIYNSKERSKLTALHRLKLFGSSSRPSGIQVGLADHLTTRKREGNLYSTTISSTTTTTTTKPSTTKIPLYKKILHQRPTLKPTFLLKNTAVMAKTETERMVTSWDSKEQQETDYIKPEEEIKPQEEKEEDEVELMEDDEDLLQNMPELSTKIPELSEATTWKMETTIAPTFPSSTTSTSTPRSATKHTSEKSTTRDIATSTRRMYTSTRGSGRTTFRYTTSTTTPATTTSTTTTTTTTTTPLPETTTTTTSTTTASSSTMNLTPKAHLNLNTEDLRERIQETLLKNLIEKEDSFKKSPIAEENDDDDEEDDLENFFEETIKPKTTKYLETSTITTRMKQYNPSFLYTSTTSTSTSTPPPSTNTNPTTTENLNSIPDFDNVDDRTDLLELIEDRRSGNRLFKVLEQRNMTLEELIEHRKRGSSQLHLATIVETPSLFYPDKKVVLQDNMDIVTAFENFPHFNLLNLKSVKPDDIKTDSQGSSYFTSIIDIEPTDEVYKNRKGGQALTAELDKASLLPDRSEKSLGFFPSWKTLALASLGPTNNKKETASKLNTNNSPFYLQQPKMLLENNSNNNDENDDDDEDIYDIKENELTLIGQDEEDDYQQQNPIQAAVRLPDHTAEAIENEVARAHDLVDLELSGHGFKRSPQAAGALAHSHRHGSFYNNMPPGIKSAIVASASIVLTALVTFMVIFAVCKWKQRRHRMSNIMKSYNAMKSKLPTIATTTMGAASTANTTNSNSRRSSLREMQNLLGGSGLSVAATITTTASTGVPNTPIHTAATPSSPPLTASQTTTMLAGNCSKNINNIYNHNSNNSNNTTNSNSSNYNCGLRPLQRQSSLLFQRSFNQNNSHSATHSNNDKPTNLSILSGCNLLDLKRNNKMSGSTTSLSFSLTSGHNISNTHINTMDANSPEVQEYLFDTLRNSF